MASEWKTVPLTDLYDIGSGLSKPRSEFGFGHGFLTFKDVLDNYFVPDQLSALVNSTEKEQANCSIMRGDVFLTRTSETQPELGMSSVALKDYPKATFNGFTKRLRPKTPDAVVPEYAAYCFRGPRFRQSVTSMSSLSTRASLNNEMISRLSIVLPPVPEQKAIGIILKAIDDKIELNRRRNRTLEAMARAVFQSWFVDFDPVRAKAAGRKPAGLSKELAALFPKEFEPSELGEIPKGWRVESLDRTANFLNGLALQKYPPSDGETLSVIKIAQLRRGDSVGADRCNTNVPPAYVVEDGDVLFSWSGSLECVLWTGGTGALNQHLFKVTSGQYAKWFCYLWVHHHLPHFRHVAEGKATTMGHIQRHHLTDAKVVIADSALHKQSDELLSPLVEQIIHHNIESRTLAALRDTLLPKLISGELRVPDAERIVGRAV